jgi:L-seryl-tRNA(Ser) seleniumtransferase
MPELIGASGAVLREVGTTNRTRLQDFQEAIGPATGALMQVRAGNYIVQGSVEATPLEQLVELGQRHQLPVIDHCAGGALIDLAPYGLVGQPIVGDSIRTGADVVLLSGDRLLGGPQAGILLGKRSWLEKIERHPWAAALRMDKLALAALAGTLRLYVKATGWEESLPLLAMLSTSPDNLRHRAQRIQTQLASSAVVEACEVVASTTYLEGAAVPAQRLSSYCVVLTGRQRSSEQLARQLRMAEPPVIARVHEDRIWLDLRSVLPAQDRQLVDAICSLGVPSGDTDTAAEAAVPSAPEPVE